MSTLTPTTQAARDRSTNAVEVTRERRRGRVASFVTVVVLVWSTVELVNLATKHTTGPELYGVLTAALATGAGIASLAVLRSSRPPLLVVGAVVVLWAVIALGGMAGTLAHIVGPVAGHGPVDLRPRPVAAPLIFTLLGVVGGGALVYGQRPVFRRVLDRGKE
jgi:peptidoglycan/LPS O-acetylase OafA/YrhL